jgi:hypothetical protein
LTKITLKSIIVALLNDALDWYLKQIELSSPDPLAVDGGVKLKTINLSKTNDNIKITYKSAIARQLARQSGPMELAEKLAQYCRHQGVADCRSDTPSQKPGFLKKPGFLAEGFSTAHLEVKVVPPGLLLFDLTDSGIAAWLQYLCEELPLSVVEKDLPFLVSEHLFKIQYSHARCCSLLRMADAVFPVPISWQETDEKLRFNHPAERGLISQIFSTWDLLYLPTATPQKINWQKVATALSEAFQIFYSQCRLLGEVKIQRPELAKARLGLISIAKYLLQFLLEEKLKIKAPTEL